MAKVKKLISAVLPLSPNVGESSATEVNDTNKCVVDRDICNLEELDTPVVQDDALPWLTFQKCKLTYVDKAVITSGSRLTDMHINFAQSILQVQFVNVIGLHSTLLLCKHTNPLLVTDGNSQALQIIHSRGDHWIVATTIQCPANTVRIYDSVYSHADKATLTL